MFSMPSLIHGENGFGRTNFDVNPVYVIVAGCSMVFCQCVFVFFVIICCGKGNRKEVKKIKMSTTMDEQQKKPSQELPKIEKSAETDEISVVQNIDEVEQQTLPNNQLTTNSAIISIHLQTAEKNPLPEQLPLTRGMYVQRFTCSNYYPGFLLT